MDTIDVVEKYVTTTITTAARVNATTIITLGNRIVDAVEILFAAGHVGLTGVAISYNGVQMIPYGQVGAFIFGDNVRLPFKLGIYGPGKWTITTHNGDTAPHLHQLTWSLHELPVPMPLPPAQPIPLVIA